MILNNFDIQIQFVIIYPNLWKLENLTPNWGGAQCLDWIIGNSITYQSDIAFNSSRAFQTITHSLHRAVAALRARYAGCLRHPSASTLSSLIFRWDLSLSILKHPLYQKHTFIELVVPLLAFYLALCCRKFAIIKIHLNHWY